MSAGSAIGRGKGSPAMWLFSLPRRAGADEALHTLPSLEYRGLDPPVVGGAPALVQDSPDKFGHKIGRDPVLQLGGQGCGHDCIQLLAVVHHGWPHGGV